MIQIKRWSENVLAAMTFGFVLLNAACTNDPHAMTEQGATAATTKSKASVVTRACTNEMLASFADHSGVVLDLEREALPKGLYLATLSELQLVKKESDVTGRLIAREVSGTRTGEILCAENMTVFGDDFSLALLGPVKVDTSQDSSHENLTVRQFYVFADKNGHGMVLSNPELDRRGQDLKAFLNTGASRGQIVRYSNRQYAIRLSRDQDGAQARLLIRLDLVKSN